MVNKTFYWHDYETFGANPMFDRPAQFAGIRTDEDLNIIGDPLMVYCKPADDMIPHPDACMITGITPQVALEKGVPEAEFIKQIHHEFSKPGTCVVGYNNIRFDDEVTRYTLYRNFYDPYAREWKNGNSRWDIIDMVRLCKALRPEGINWPFHPDGKPSFRLENISESNGISHESAHDALSDVIATIELAKLIKKNQPRLYEFICKIRDKREVLQLLNLFEKKPVLHVSSKYPADRGCISLVIPIASHPTNKNVVYVYDLRSDPTEMIGLTAEQIRERIFIAADALPEGVERIPIKAVHINKCPVIVPVATMSPQQAEQYDIDIDLCERHRQQIITVNGLSDKIQEVFSANDFDEITDPDQMLYSGGFFSSDDRRKMDLIRKSSPEKLKEFDMPFGDNRIPEMLFRYRARNFPDTLSKEESERWQEYRKYRILNEDGGSGISYNKFVARIDELLSQTDIENDKKTMLLDIKEYGELLTV